MTIKIVNYADNDIVYVSLPLLVGEIISTGDSKIFVQNSTLGFASTVWPVTNGKFKVLVELINGENLLIFQHKNKKQSFSLFYHPLHNERFVRLVCIKCQDDSGTFQAPKEEDNSIKSACKRLSLAAKMLQTFTLDKLKEHNLTGKTFRLEEKEHSSEVICHVFTSSLSLSEARKLNEEELWSHFAVELMNSSLRIGNHCKFLAFLSFTSYKNNFSVPPINHHQVIQMTKGHVALGGGGLALFGTGCLHTWPENMQQVPWRFGDKRKIDRMRFMDDSANRGWFWACYSTGLGATLHELGHTFDLGHTTGGIMGRGFDDIYKHFIIDMFYHDHSFQKEYNPFYQGSSVLKQCVPITPINPSGGSISNQLRLSAKDQNSTKKYFSENYQVCPEETAFEKPWKIPNPPEVISEDKLAVHVGGAYWTRSSALILYFHKWFNNTNSETEISLSEDGFEIFSPHGIKIIEFRDKQGTSFHHLEFLEVAESNTVDLKKCNILCNIPNDTDEVSFLVEDSVGNLLKSKLNIKQLVSKN